MADDSYTVHFWAIDNITPIIEKINTVLDKKLANALNRLKFDMLGLGFFFQQFGKILNSVFNESKNFLGISLEMARAVGGDLYNALLTLQASFNTFAVTLLSDAEPSITKIANSLTTMFDSYIKLDPEVRKMTGNFSGFLVVAAPVLSVLFFMGLGLQTLYNWITGVFSILGLLISKLTLMGISLSSVGGFIVIVTLLAIAFWNAIDMVFNKKGPEALNFFQKGLAVLGMVIFEVFSNFLNILNMVEVGIAIFVLSGLQKFVDFKVGVLNVLADLMEKASKIPFIGSLFGGVATGLQAAANLGEGVSKALGSQISGLKTSGENAYTGIRNSGDRINNMMGRLFGGNKGGTSITINMTESDLATELSKQGVV